MESDVVLRMPVQIWQLIQLLGLGCLILSWLLFAYGLAQKLNGSKRKWIRTLLVSIMFFVLFGISVFITITTELFDERTQRMFDQNITIPLITEENQGR